MYKLIICIDMHAILPKYVILKKIDVANGNWWNFSEKVKPGNVAQIKNTSQVKVNIFCHIKWKTYE